MKIKVKGVYNSLLDLLKQIKLLIKINGKHYKGIAYTYHGKYLLNGSVCNYEYECDAPKLSNNNFFYIQIKNYDLEEKSLEGPI